MDKLSFSSKMMRRCFQLALQGLGNVAPNPLVGCVITYNEQIIGEGYHKQFGQAHAEVNAINSVKDKRLLKNSTLYVNLEPCAHQGKTPPCADLIIKMGIPRVVICNEDPFDQVSGKGIQKMENAGISVVVGVEEEMGFELNKRFFTFHLKKRPWIILKWAETIDGFIDKDRNQDDSPAWITSPLLKQLVHKWRTEEQSILVGQNTVALDNPRLTSREWSGKNPVRLVLSPVMQIQKDKNILDDSCTSIIYNFVEDKTEGSNIYKKIVSGQSPIIGILKDLYERGIQSVIVEGGAQILSTFIETETWDEIRQFVVDKYFVSGIRAPEFEAQACKVEYFGNNRLYLFKNNKDTKALL